MDRFQFPPIDPQKLLVVRVCGDEATGALAASQVSSRLFNLAAQFAEFIMLGSEQGSMKILEKLFAPVWFIGLLWGGALWWQGNFEFTSIFVPMAAMILLYMMFNLVPHLFAWIVACYVVPLGMVPQYVAGLDALFIGLDRRIFAEAAPVGDSRVITFEGPSMRNSKWLAHTMIYENKFVIATIAKWIQNLSNKSDRSE